MRELFGKYDRTTQQENKQVNMIMLAPFLSTYEFIVWRADLRAVRNKPIA